MISSTKECIICSFVSVYQTCKHLSKPSFSFYKSKTGNLFKAVIFVHNGRYSPGILGSLYAKPRLSLNSSTLPTSHQCFFLWQSFHPLRGAKRAANLIKTLAMEPQYTWRGQNVCSSQSSRMLNMQSKSTRRDPRWGQPITDVCPAWSSLGCHKSPGQSISITSTISWPSSRDTLYHWGDLSGNVKGSMINRLKLSQQSILQSQSRPQYKMV